MMGFIGLIGALGALFGFLFVVYIVNYEMHFSKPARWILSIGGGLIMAPVTGLLVMMAIWPPFSLIYSVVVMGLVVLIFALARWIGNGTLKRVEDEIIHDLEYLKSKQPNLNSPVDVLGLETD